MERIGSVLQRIEPELIISKQRIRQVERIALVRNKRELGNQNLCFSSRLFVLCGLPVRKLPEGDLMYERRERSVRSSGDRAS